MPASFIDQVLDQGKRLDDLLSKANAAQAKLRDSSDRVFYSLQDSFSFQQGQNVPQNLIFNVPQSDDFDAVRLSIYPYIRRISTDSAINSDVVFRPTIWTFQHDAVNVFYFTVDALLELVVAGPDGKTRACQNAAFFAAQTFSAYTTPINGGITGNAQEADRSESPSAFVFDPCWRLTKGSTVTVRVTPLFSGQRYPDLVSEDELIYEYQIRGVLEGYKRVR